MEGVSTTAPGWRSSEALPPRPRWITRAATLDPKRWRNKFPASKANGKWSHAVALSIMIIINLSIAIMIDLHA